MTDAQIADLAAQLRALEDRVKALEGAPEDEALPRWLQAARGELGVKEIPGPEHNDRVLEYLATTRLGRWAQGRDETPWCSAFVNWCMARAGQEGTDSAAARSWLGWGVELEEPKVGCVVVLKRGAPPSGHVALFERQEGTTLHLLGGNQANSVCVKPYPVSRLLSYRWPVEG